MSKCEATLSSRNHTHTHAQFRTDSVTHYKIINRFQHNMFQTIAIRGSLNQVINQPVNKYRRIKGFF